MGMNILKRRRGGGGGEGSLEIQPTFSFFHILFLSYFVGCCHSINYFTSEKLTLSFYQKYPEKSH